MTDALGRVIAENIYSDSDIPAFDNSAMDGYAVCSSDTKNASRDTPKILEVIDDIKAGQISRKIIKVNQAIRIMTGAPIPKGADSVIMVEETEKLGKDKVKIFKETEAKENIRRAGEDIKKGECVLTKGTLLKPAHIGLLASLGYKTPVQYEKEQLLLATKI
ncbi:MAG: hypothetical protein NC834_02995 [Candidatus Omnitrophica bacterium]|nr:hypothetical protein [Candidatus Omnitrophota bacterium]